MNSQISLSWPRGIGYDMISYILPRNDPFRCFDIIRFGILVKKAEILKILKNLIIGNSHWKIRLRSLQLEWMRFSHPSDQEVSENIQGAMIDPTQGEPTSLLVQQKCDFPDSFSKKRPFFMIFWYFFIWRSALNIANPYIFWMYVQFPFQWYIIHVYIKGWGDLIIFSQREGWLSISGNPHFEPCHMSCRCIFM